MSFFKASYIFLCLLFCCITFYASAQLKANFTASATSGCAPLIVQFTDQSTGNPTAWNWDFGNQKFNTVTTPATQSTTYPNPGIYVVTLAVSNGSTASTSTVVITVYNKPVADFKINPNPSCVGQPVLFSDSSKISQGGKPIRQWAWDFGDGSFQNTTNGLARNEYTLSGTFPVSLIISDENGCSSSKIKNITITPFPKPSFTTSTSFKCNPPLQVNFTNTSGNSPQATIKWLFGDTKSASTSNASNTYTTFGEFDVSLIISQNGCTDTLTIDDKVIIRTIKADFTTSSASVCAGKSLSFNNTSFPPAATSKWTFGDGKSSNSNNTTNSFATAGNYPVTLMATDANGCKDTITKTISVGKVPVVNFTTIKNQACSVPMGFWRWHTFFKFITYVYNSRDLPC